MSRPIKCRKINQNPLIEYFKPAEISSERLQQVRLTIDEFEAVRLADLEGLYQELAAEQMGVSRQTFGNILAMAHRKIADALVNAKAIQIGGGKVNIAEKSVRCQSCQHQWNKPCCDTMPAVCPACGDTAIQPAGPVDMAGVKKKKCRKFCRRMNHESMHTGPGQ